MAMCNLFGIEAGKGGGLCVRDKGHLGECKSARGHRWYSGSCDAASTTRKVTLEVDLPPGLAELAEALQREAPELLSSFVRYGIMRNEIYRAIRAREVDVAKHIAEGIAEIFRGGP